MSDSNDIHFIFSDQYKRFMDRLVSRIRKRGVVLPEGQYATLAEYAITILALDQFGLRSPRRLPNTHGGYRPGAGRPKLVTPKEPVDS